MHEISVVDRVLLAYAWIKREDERIICVACGGLRRPDEPPCSCLSTRSRVIEWGLSLLREQDERRGDA